MNFAIADRLVELGIDRTVSEHAAAQCRTIEEAIDLVFNDDAELVTNSSTIKSSPRLTPSKPVHYIPRESTCRYFWLLSLIFFLLCTLSSFSLFFLFFLHFVFSEFSRSLSLSSSLLLSPPPLLLSSIPPHTTHTQSTKTYVTKKDLKLMALIGHTLFHGKFGIKLSLLISKVQNIARKRNMKLLHFYKKQINQVVVMVV